LSILVTLVTGVCCAPLPAAPPQTGVVLDAADGGTGIATIRLTWPRRLLTLGPLTPEDVGAVALRLYRVSGNEETLRATIWVTRAALSQAVAIRHLRADTTYRLRGEAYAGASPVPASLLSATGAGVNHLEWQVGRDDAPTVLPLVVQLADVDRVVVSTVSVGHGVLATEGLARERQLYGATGAAVGADGALYVAEETGHRVVRISPSGILTTFVGSGVRGALDGSGTAAQFNQPQGLAFGPDGTLYVTEAGGGGFSNRVRKVSPAGVVTTLAGGLSGNFLDGTGTAALFNCPRGVAVAADGTVYVADQFNHRVRAITPAGVVSTLAGGAETGLVDGTGAAARFSYPWGLTLGPDGNLYVADAGNRAVRRVTPSGVVTTVAGPEHFTYPLGLALGPDGTVYVADGTRLKAVGPNGAVTTVAGGPTAGHMDGPAALARFQSLQTVTLAPGGALNLVDVGGYVRRLSPDGQVSTVAGVTWGAEGVGLRGGLSDPEGIKVDPSGGIVVADTFNHRILRVTPEGAVTTLAGWDDGDADDVATRAMLSRPKDVALGSDGAIWIADTQNNKIRKLTPGGEVVTVAGSTGGLQDGPGAQARFYTPHGLAVGADGAVYVADGDNHAIRKIVEGPVGASVSTLAGGIEGPADGTGAEAQFAYPTGLAFGPDGALYVADRYNHRIRRVTTGGVVTTFAGSTPGSVDGRGTEAAFNEPTRLAFDASGFLWVVDAGSHRVRRISPDGWVTTVAGGEQGFADGVATGAAFSQPAGIAVAPDGTVWVSDTLNSALRRLQ
jgi:sugar lactone lactonase YvrE